VPDLRRAETDSEPADGRSTFKNLVYFVVDFDSQKDAVKSFGARMQSTLIAFKGEHETGRSVGDTDRASIAALLNKTL